MHRPLAFLLAVTLVHAADEPRWRTLNRTAREAVQAKDYAKLRATLLELQPLIPGNPRIAYNLAASESMLGHHDAALTALHNWAAMGLVYDVASDADFASLRAAPEFQQIIDRVGQNKQPVARASVAFTLPSRDLLPEDIAYDP